MVHLKGLEADRAKLDVEIAEVKRELAHRPGGLKTPDAKKATRMMEALHDGNRQAFGKMLQEDSNIATLKGPGGSTPLMYAAIIVCRSHRQREVQHLTGRECLRNEA